MSVNSRIEWTERTWQVTSGCTPISPGCAHCYASTMARRLGAMKATAADYGGLTNSKHFNGTIRLLPDRLMQPLSWRKPQTVFVDSMSDLFHPDVPFEFIDKVWSVMALTPQHTYLILTKRTERMAEYLNDEERVPSIQDQIIAMKGGSDEVHRAWFLGFPDWTGWPPPNVHLGTSAEDQQRLDERVVHLLRCPAAVRFLSLEPLLSGVDLTPHLWKRCDRGCSVAGYDTAPGFPGGHRCPGCHATGDEPRPGFSPTRDIGLVICGGESGPGARPCEVDWIRSIVRQCAAAGVACFVKQAGSYVVARNDELATDDPPADPPSWPEPDCGWDDGAGGNLTRLDSGYQGAPVRIHLRDRKGGDMAEWPADLRVRQMPRGGSDAEVS